MEDLTSMIIPVSPEGQRLRRYMGNIRRYYAWRVSIFGVFLVLIFPHLDLIRRDTPCNTDQENSEYGHFLRNKNYFSRSENNYYFNILFCRPSTLLDAKHRSFSLCISCGTFSVLPAVCLWYSHDWCVLG